MYFLVILFFVVFSCSEEIVHRCIHDHLDDHRRAIREQLAMLNETGLRRGLPIPRFFASFEQIRVNMDTSNLDSDLTGNSALLNFLKTEIISEANSVLNNLIKTVRQTSPITVARSSSWCQTYNSDGSCSSSADVYIGSNNLMKIPKSHLTTKDICTSSGLCTKEGGGVDNMDYLLYVGSKSDNCDSGTVAYAAAAFVDTIYGYPKIGFINLCESQFTVTDNKIIKNQYVHVIIHEIFHALGFSSDFFSSFIYPDGMPRYQATTQSFSGERGYTPVKFVSENALKAAREHFNCDTLNGLEVEAGGGTGTAGSHTEGRIFRGDFMNGVISPSMKYSPISLSIMEDSGWYKINWANAENLHFGKDAGCDFAMEKCLSEPKSDPTINGPTFGHYCKTSSAQSCSSDRKSIGTCQIQSLSSIPSHFQYFTDSTRGGSETMDYCPYYTESVSDFCTRVDTSVNTYGEQFGDNSLCFDSSLTIDSSTVSATPKCYSTSCADENTLNIHISGMLIDGNRNETVTCTTSEKDQLKTVGNGWGGSIKCPDVGKFCGSFKSYTFSPVELDSGLSLYLTIGGIALGVIVLVIVSGILLYILCVCCKPAKKTSSDNVSLHRNSKGGHRLGSRKGSRKSMAVNSYISNKLRNSVSNEEMDLYYYED